MPGHVTTGMLVQQARRAVAVILDGSQHAVHAWVGLNHTVDVQVRTATSGLAQLMRRQP